MELPPAAIHDSKTHLRERAICDERISLPLSAFEELDTVYSKLAAQFGTQEAMVEVKVNWRCTNVIWWAAVVDDEDLARTYYAKLGDSVAETEGFISKARELGPAGGGLGLKAEGKHPPLTLENLSSIMAPDSKKQNFGHRRKLHGFWGKMECGLVLSSMSPWEYVPKEQGVRKAGGFACKFCEGFWKAKAGSSRVVQLYGRSGQTKVALQLILDEPPERLYQKWIQDRMAYYLCMEPMGASRDEALDLDYPVQERIRFSVQNGSLT